MKKKKEKKISDTHSPSSGRSGKKGKVAAGEGQKIVKILFV